MSKLGTIRQDWERSALSAILAGVSPLALETTFARACWHTWAIVINKNTISGRNPANRLADDAEYFSVLSIFFSTRHYYRTTTFHWQCLRSNLTNMHVSTIFRSSRWYLGEPRDRLADCAERNRMAAGWQLLEFNRLAELWIRPHRSSNRSSIFQA